jgi:hypothetical protein
VPVNHEPGSEPTSGAQAVTASSRLETPASRYLSDVGDRATELRNTGEGDTRSAASGGAADRCVRVDVTPGVEPTELQRIRPVRGSVAVVGLESR